MSFMGNLKGRSAVTKQSKGQNAEALALYEQALAAGMNNPRYILAYSVLLLRSNEF